MWRQGQYVPRGSIMPQHWGNVCVIGWMIAVITLTIPVSTHPQWHHFIQRPHGDFLPKYWTSTQTIAIKTKSKQAYCEWFQPYRQGPQLLIIVIRNLLFCLFAPIDQGPDAHVGPPHVLWEVSFGFWVTWSISSWQENYKSVFFPKLQFLNDKLQLYPKKLFGTLAKLFWSIYHSKVSKLKK